jgi:hypothetical protein
MTHHDHDQHASHDHAHGADCGHVTVMHAGHSDYAHDGHLHHVHDDHVDEHVIDIDAANPADCAPDHACAVHDGGHAHATDCGHPGVPHGDHTDYLVQDHLHHPHDSHCDDHGRVSV